MAQRVAEAAGHAPKHGAGVPPAPPAGKSWRWPQESARFGVV